MRICRLSQGNHWYTFYNKTEGKVFVAKTGVFLEKEFLAKGLSGRTIELDVVNGTEQDEQSSAAPEVVPEVATAPEAPAPPSVEVPVIEPSIEPRRSGIALKSASLVPGLGAKKWPY